MGAMAPVRGRPGPKESVAEQMAEMVTLNALSAQRPLSHEESERLGLLIQREQKRARYRPARIQRLKAELALLESLEIAARGAEAVPAAAGDVDAERGADGSWSVPQRRAA